MNGQVERQMRKSIKMTADFWYTAWVDAGQPDLNELLRNPLPAALDLEEKMEEIRVKDVREHEGPD